MTTCPCGSETTNGYVCRVCQGRLRADLRRIAELWPETEVALTRQTATGSGGGGGSGKGGIKSTPLPFDANASEVRWDIENAVMTWVRDIAGDQVPEGVHDVPTAALWLSHNVQKIAGVPQGPEALNELTGAHRRIMRLVDRPESPVYLGMHDCGSDIWAKGWQSMKRCDCEVMLDLDQIRADKMYAARSTWASARAIGEAARKIAGVHVTKVMISRWYKAGDLEGDHRMSADRKTIEYRVGAVLDLARRHAERNVAV